MSDLDDRAEEQLVNEWAIREEKRRNDRTICGSEFDTVIAELRGEVDRLKERVKTLETKP